MKLLDPKIGGKLRTVIQILSAIAAALIVFQDVPKVAVILPFVSAIISGLTHLTGIGNEP